MHDISELIIEIHRTRCNIQGCVYGFKGPNGEPADRCMYCKRTTLEKDLENFDGIR